MADKYIEQAPQGEKTSPNGQERLPITDGTNDWYIKIANLVAEKLRETGGNVLSMGAVSDGEFLKRSGSTITSQAVSPSDGWLDLDALGIYSTAQAPNWLVYSNTDQSSKLHRGMRVKFTQAQAMTAYWTFNSGSTPDVGSFVCTDTNMAYTSGKFSNAGTFNGATSKIVVTDSANLKPTGEFTVGCWFKTSASGVEQDIFASFARPGANFAGILLRVHSNNKAGFYIGTNTSSATDVTGPTTVTDGAWHHVVATWRGNYLQVYLDGQLEIATYAFTPAYGATNYVRIGCRNDTGADLNFFNGQIDDLFFIKDYALDEKTIRDLYRSGAAKGTNDFSVDRYFIVTYVAPYTGGSQLIYLYGGTDYGMHGSNPITNPKYSAGKAPYGFPTSPDKWTVLFMDYADRSQAPVLNTWYNLGSAAITVPIGSWYLYYRVSLGNAKAAAATLQGQVTLSTANNSESNKEFTNLHAIATGTSFITSMSAENAVNLNAATTYYLNSRAYNFAADTIANYNGSGLPLVIRARCAHL